MAWKLWFLVGRGESGDSPAAINQSLKSRRSKKSETQIFGQSPSFFGHLKDNQEAPFDLKQSPRTPSLFYRGDIFSLLPCSCSVGSALFVITLPSSWTREQSASWAEAN